MKVVSKKKSIQKTLDEIENFNEKYPELFGEHFAATHSMYDCEQNMTGDKKDPFTIIEDAVRESDIYGFVVKTTYLDYAHQSIEEYYLISRDDFLDRRIPMSQDFKNGVSYHIVADDDLAFPRLAETVHGQTYMTEVEGWYLSVEALNEYIPFSRQHTSALLQYHVDYDIQVPDETGKEVYKEERRGESVMLNEYLIEDIRAGIEETADRNINKKKENMDRSEENADRTEDSFHQKTDLSDWLSDIDFDYYIDKDGKIRLIDLTDVYLGDIGNESFRDVDDLFARLEIYVENQETEGIDYVLITNLDISEDAVSEMSLEEKVSKAKKGGLPEYIYKWFDDYLHPENVTVCWDRGIEELERSLSETIEELEKSLSETARELEKSLSKTARELERSFSDSNDYDLEL